MTGRILLFRPRATPTSSELTSEQLLERAARLERDPLRATQSAAEARQYIEAAIRSVEASTAGTPAHRAEAVEALRDGLALMAMGLGHVIEATS